MKEHQATRAGRRKFLAVAATTLALPAIARAKDKVTFRYATNVTLDNPLNVRLNEAFERIRTQSSGVIDFKLFPNGQLGSDPAMLGQVRSGALDFFALSTVLLSALVPSAAIPGVGFAFPDYDSVWKALDGDLGAFIRRDIEKNGLIAMDQICNTGFRQMTTSTSPIKTAADLQGRKMRIPASPLWTSMFEAFGSAPTAVNWNETYTALQTKMVDGAELPLSTIYTGKLFEVQKNLSLTRHMWDGWWQLVNPRVWGKLDAGDKALISKNLNQAAVDTRTDMSALDQSVLESLKKSGMQVFDVDRKSFQVKLKSTGFYASWKSKFGDEAWSLLEKYTGPIS